MKVKRHNGVNVIKPVWYGFMLFVFMVSFITITAQAQQSEVTGTVTDEDSSPLPGVSVLIKGTTTGSITDTDGIYKVTVENAEAVLVFSFVGYVTKEEVVGNRSIIDMPLTPDVTALDEIVVVGYGTQKKKDLTGAIASADLEAMDTQPNVSFLEGLQGTVPGLNVGQVNEVGESPDLSIRGRTSISGEQDPLIVLDGVIYRGALLILIPII